MERKVRPEIPSPSSRANERVREHCGAVARPGSMPHSALQVAVSVGARRCFAGRGVVDKELPRIYASSRNLQTEAVVGRQNGGSGFFQKCLAKSRGSTPAERYLWREGVYDEIRDAVARQFEYRANVPIGPGQSGGIHRTLVQQMSAALCVGLSSTGRVRTESRAAKC